MEKGNRPYKKFGGKLKEMRGKSTQKDFAKAIGLSERAYQRYESGERLPPIDTVFSIVEDVVNLPEKRHIEVMRAFYRSVSLRDYGIDPGDDEIDKFISDLKKGDLEAIPRLIKKKTESVFIVDKYLQEDQRFIKAFDLLKIIFHYGTDSVKDLTIKSLETFLEMAMIETNIDIKQILKNLDSGS